MLILSLKHLKNKNVFFQGYEETTLQIKQSFKKTYKFY